MADTSVKSNGQSKISNAVSNGKSQISGTNGKSELPVNGKPETPAPQPEVKEPSVSEKIQKVNELNILIEKYQKLAEARTNLRNFSLGNDGMSSRIILEDSNGKEFKTSHPLVIQTVVSTLANVVDEKMTQVEKDINFTM